MKYNVKKSFLRNFVSFEVDFKSGKDMKNSKK